MTPSLRLSSRTALLLVAAVLLGASFAPAVATAQEAEGPAPVTVTLTAEGIAPEFIEVPVGGSVVFVNDDTEPHRVTATAEEGKSTVWEYDSGVLAPKDGETRASSQTPPFQTAGRYTFNDARGLLLTTSRADEINALPPPPPPVQGEPAPAGEPSAQPSSGPSGEPAPGASGGATSGGPPPGDASAGASPGAPAGAPAPTGGTGTTAPLPLSGEFGSFGSTPQPIPGLDPLAPAIAPPLELAAPPTALLPDVAAPAPSAETRTPGIAALPTGSLPGATTDRAYGLPAALATVTILGVVSLLVRVLLAEPLPGRSGGAALPPRSVAVTA